MTPTVTRYTFEVVVHGKVVTHVHVEAAEHAYDPATGGLMGAAYASWWVIWADGDGAALWSSARDGFGETRRNESTLWSLEDALTEALLAVTWVAASEAKELQEELDELEDDVARAAEALREAYAAHEREPDEVRLKYQRERLAHVQAKLSEFTYGA